MRTAPFPVLGDITVPVASTVGVRTACQSQVGLRYQVADVAPNRRRSRPCSSALDRARYVSYTCRQRSLARPLHGNAAATPAVERADVRDATWFPPRHHQPSSSRTVRRDRRIALLPVSATSIVRSGLDGETRRRRTSVVASSVGQTRALRRKRRYDVVRCTLSGFAARLGVSDVDDAGGRCHAKSIREARLPLPAPVRECPRRLSPARQRARSRPSVRRRGRAQRQCPPPECKRCAGRDQQ